MRTPCLSITKLLALTSLVLACNQVWAEAGASNKGGRIIKWVDEKGITHYGDSLPVQDANRNNSVLNNQGLVVKRNQPAIAVKPEEDKASVDQQRHDRALLAAYSSGQDIDSARDRNLQPDETAIKELEQRMSIAQARMDANKKLADDYIKRQRKKPIPSDLNQELQNNSTEIAQIKQQIAQRQQSMEATRQRYENDKRRFVELNPHDPNSPVAAPGEIAAPVPASKPVSAAPAPKPATSKR